MKRSATVLTLVLLAAPAFAQDDPAKKPNEPPAPAPAPGGDAKKPDAPPAKKERKTSAEADAAMKKYESLLSFRPSEIKSGRVRMEGEIPQLGGAIKIDCRWEKGKDATYDVELPEALLQQIPPAMQDMLKKKMGSQMAGKLFEGMSAHFVHYDVAGKTTDGKFSIELTPYDEQVEFDKAVLTFDGAGLLEKQVVTPHVDPSNPQAAMMAGMEIESAFKHAKRGDRFVVESMTSSTPMGDQTVAYTYFDVKDQPALVKSLEISSPMMPEPMVMSFHDWEIDGKTVAGTEKKDDAAKPAEKKDAKPAEKPADKPGENPAPVPPAPKDGDK